MPNDRLPDPLSIEALAAPLVGPSACGPDLEYDPAYAALQAAAAGRPERQYGETIYPAEPPDWIAVRAQALALAERTRDLRVAVWLVRSQARVVGLVGAVAGLELIRALLERHWDEVHPLLDASDADDPTARLNALYPLHHDEGLADLRAAALVPGRGATTVRELELAFGRSEPHAGEAVPAEAQLRDAVGAAQSVDPALASAMADGATAALGIARVLDDRLGAGAAPDIAPLVRLLQAVAAATPRPAAAAVAEIVVPGMAQQAAARGEIGSRADAIRALGRVCEWLEANEPTHPAPILIGRAQRLLGKKNFLEVIRDLVPDAIDQIEKLAGPASE